MLSKRPKWPLGAEASVLSASTRAPFNLPLLSASTWLASEWKRKERVSNFFLYLFLSFLLKKTKKKKNSAPSYTPLRFSSGYLVQPNLCGYRSCHCTGTDMKRGCTKKKDVEGCNCWKWDGEKETVEVENENIKGHLCEKREMEKERKGSSFCSLFGLTWL